MSDPLANRRAAAEASQETAVARILSDLRKTNGWTLSEVSRSKMARLSPPIAF